MTLNRAWWRESRAPAARSTKVFRLNSYGQTVSEAARCVALLGCEFNNQRGPESALPIKHITRICNVQALR